MCDRDGISRKPYKVFVSSTYLDNRTRRKIVQDAITSAGMLWHGMELIPASNKPILDECLKYASEADVLVGIIAWRYGWIPEGRCLSITELEYGASKERLMFLLDRTKDFNVEDLDPGIDRWDKQKKLETFIARFSEDQMPAAFVDENLGHKVYQALMEWRERKETESIEIREPAEEIVRLDEDAKLEKEIRSYCDKAASLHTHLPVTSFATRLRVPIGIEDIYVPLRAMVDLRGVKEEQITHGEQAEKCLKDREAELEISLLDAFKESERRDMRGVVILGDPGSGKTTHLKQLLLWCLRNEPESIHLPRRMLPVFLPLQELKDLNHGLEAFIQDQLQKPHLGVQPGFGERLLERGNLLFLLDGLDEVADLKQREKVSQWIEDALQANRSCRFVVTCRYAGYSDRVPLNEHFLEMHIRTLTAGQAEAFIRKWYDIVEKGLSKDPDQAGLIAEEKAEKLIACLREPELRTRRVTDLTRNPLLLANLCLVDRHRGSLPKKRSRLYMECIDVLLEHWRTSRGLDLGLDAQESRRVLQPAALWMHKEEGRIRASQKELAPIIEPGLKAVGWKGGTANEFLRMVRDVSGLLTGLGPENYGFMHLGFQEYLAAREIRSRAFSDPGILKELAFHFGESWWREVGLLLLAQEEPSHFTCYMREVLKIPAFAKHPDLVEDCLEDAAETSPEPFLELVEEQPGEDPECWKRQFLALRFLERLDPEAAEGIRPMLAEHPSPEIRKWVGVSEAKAEQDILIDEKTGYELVRIEGGTFQMGSPKPEEDSPDSVEERWPHEEPRHSVQVASFYMGRFPVTNRVYARFLEENPDVPEPGYWGDRRLNEPGQPVVGVSWKEAARFASWAGLRLPTEAEWEYACRAGTQTRFHAGDSEEDLAKVGWYDGNSGGKLHPVGEKEPNGFGLCDMHGNVWEWVEDDWHDNYEGAPADGSAWIKEPRGAYRVMRGGTWSFAEYYCRSAARDGPHPDARNSILGFRLAASVT